MKRQLSARELILLGMLLVIVLVGGYLLLFYLPMTEELDRLEQDRISCEEQFVPAQARIEDKLRMEQELKEIFEADPEPASLALYDNQKPVMHELNAVLQSASEYYLSFSTAETGREDGIVRRRISLSFTSGSYEAAKEVLGSLHGSVYRCMLDDLSVSLGDGGGAVTVDVALVYFECQ